MEISCASTKLETWNKSQQETYQSLIYVGFIAYFYVELLIVLLLLFRFYFARQLQLPFEIS